jgi:transglutaminase-like putative cysteine protease
VPLGAPLPPAMPGKQRAKGALPSAPFEGWFVLFLLGTALYCVVASIIASEWVSQSSWLILSPAAGLLTGLIVAKMPNFPQFILHLGACLLGHWLSVWLTSAVAYQVPWTQVLGDLRAAFTGQFMTLGASTNEIIFFFYLSFLCFFLGYFGSWLVYRAHLPWLVALVYISIMLVNLNYVKYDITYLIVVIVGALLLLIARMQLVIQVAQWKREGLHTDRQWMQSIKWRCMQAASIIVVVTLFLSWFLPIQDQDSNGKAFWDHLNTAWTDAMSGRLSWEDLSALVASGNQSNFFGNRLTISDSVQLPTSEVLRYRTADAANAPYYLESFTFNTFDGRTWTTSLDEAKPSAYPANVPLPKDVPSPDKGEKHIKVSLTLPPGGSKNYIFAPANPRTFNVPTVVYSDGTTGTWTQKEPLSAHETYEVTFVPPPVAPTVSPALGENIGWDAFGISQQYLQVPDNIGPAVKEQALAWTNGSADFYTALQQLEKHLSDTAVFKYSLKNPPEPDKVDVISWLLQTKSGYCTHYATAMTIMARMLGIPTRMVNGFSSGTYDSANGQWVVNGGDAHSWVQAFFPNHGWINFDPTPTFAPSAAPALQPYSTPTPSPSPTAVASTPTPTVVPTATSPALSGNHPNNPSSPSTPSGESGVPWVVLSLGALFLAIVFLLVVVVRRWWLNLYASSPLVSAIYWRFCRVAGFFGMAPRTSQTPYEYGQMIGQRFPHKAHSFSRLTDLFVREHWGGPQQAVQGLNEAEVKDLSPSVPSLLVNFFVSKFKRKSE